MTPFPPPLHTVREFEAAHRYDPERIERDLARLVSLIAQKRVGTVRTGTSRGR